ncbi:MAG: hypothetical protein GF311_07135 [Candidatus Lokiarchaeota archaeon]|nr:hypothetical protein [Candidatus Lokiarchaeota archaeon]
MSEIIVVDQGKKSTTWLFYVFAGILLFIAIYMPFFGGNLQGLFSEWFGQIFHWLGIGSLIIGIVFFISGVIRLFGRRGSGAISLVIGVLLLWIGSWITGISIDFLSFLGFNPPGESKGYHSMRIFINSLL